MTPNLAVDILLGKSFIHRFIRGTLPTERKAVPWHSQHDAILSEDVKCMDGPTIGNAEAESTTLIQQPSEDEKQGLVQVTRQTKLKLLTEHPVLVRTKSTEFQTIKPKQLSAH